MDLGRILSRSLEITWRYRALWLFGILLAIFGGQSGNAGNGIIFNGGGAPRNQSLPGGGLPQVPSVPTNTIILIVAIVGCIVVILVILSIIVRLVSRGALIGLVGELEESQANPAVRRGFNIGFDRFWSLFGIALLINIPLFLISLLLFIIAAIPLLAAFVPLAQAGREPSQALGPAAAGIFGSILLFCCVILFLLIIQLVLRPFYQFFMRACVIGRRGAMDSIREGYRLVRANLGNVLLLYVVLFVLAIVFIVVAFVLFLILAAIVGGVGLAVGTAARSWTPGIVAVVILGIPALILLLWVGGLYQVFDSTMWTEGFLALSAPREPAVPPAPVAPPAPVEPVPPPAT